MHKRVQEQETSTDTEDVLQEARDRMREGVEAWEDNHKFAEEDIEFRNGEQWPENVAKLRKEQGRPMLTFNKTETFVDQLVGDQRQNRPAISVQPVELDLDTGDEERVPSLRNKEGLEASDEKYTDYAVAQVYEGLIRNIEYQSKAENAYDTAFDNAAGNGFGYFRILTKYVDDGFDQEIRLERILNQFSVILDPNAEGACKEDALWGFISTWMAEKEFDKRWPGKGKLELFEGVDHRTDWTNDKKVRVAEYFRLVPVKNKLLLMESGKVVNLGHDEKEWDKQEKALKKQGIVKERIADSHKTEWYKLNGVEVLEGPTEFPSRYIPIILVPGKELVVDGKVIYRSLIRHGKDAQRNYNFWRTSATELVALAPKAPWTGGAAAFDGHPEWATANTENHAYLAFNEDTKHPPQRQQPGTVPTGALEEAQAADYDMKGTIGLHNASLGQEGNEKSGVAIRERKKEGDVGTFAFIDNLSKAIEHAGRILVDMIPRVYSNERVMRLRNIDGTEDFVRINQEVEGRKLYDLGRGKFDVAVSVGPGYTTQRQEAVDFMMSMIQASPEIMGIIGDLLLENTDSPVSKEMAKRFRKTMDPAILAKDENENGIPDNQENQPPSPEQQLAMAEAEASKAKSEATMATAEATTAKAAATIAQAEEALANLDEDIREKVAEALAEAMMQLQGAPPQQPVPTEPA